MTFKEEMKQFFDSRAGAENFSIIAESISKIVAKVSDLQTRVESLERHSEHQPE